MVNQSSTSFNQGVNFVHGGMDLLGGQVDFDDLAFLQMVLFMQQSDSDLALKMKDIRATLLQKEQITNQISYLNTFLTNSDSDANDLDHRVFMPGGSEGMNNPINPGKSECPTAKEQKVFEDGANDPWAKDYTTVTQTNAEGNLENVTQSKDRYTDADRQRFTDNSVSRKELQNKIEELKGNLEQLNSSNQVLMVELQSTMNKREQAVQFTSNILAKSHETAQAVINNLK